MRVGRYIAITVGASALLVSGVAPAAAGTLPTSGTAAGAASQAGHDQKQVPLRKVAPKGFAIGVAVAGGGHHLDQEYPDPFKYDEEYRGV